MPLRSPSTTFLPHSSPLSATTTNLTTSTTASSGASPSQLPLPSPDEPALLIPTDRSLHELESQAGSSASSGVSWLAQLGRLRVEREVVLSGYALYALRTWYLSRDHWSQSIVTQTGKQTERISVYRLVADSSLSPQEAEAEIARATQRLAGETKSTVRKTEWGSLLVTTPSAFGQDAFFVPGGDLREARPYLVVNTGLRRLGCGGRAAMTLEVPIPALRRKFLEVYRLPPPPSHPALSRTTSPQSSPSKSTSHPHSPHSPRPAAAAASVLTDPLCLMVLEVVRLIQASLALWGMFPSEEIDGLFCDETKKGIGVWRRSMGMEHEESLKIEKETSGGCIDPKTLAVLLSSITSTYYQLATLGQEKFPRDPFMSNRIHRFLGIWHTYHMSSGHSSPPVNFLSVASIRALTVDFHTHRFRSGTDPLQVHRRFFSGVASATSSISANLKVGHLDDTPLRKREHHSPSRSNTLNENGHPSGDGSSGNGLNLILPDDEVGSVASPNAITSNLESYIHGILKTREKDRDIIGARRIGALWSGHLAGAEWESGGKRRFGNLRRRTHSISKDAEEGTESSPPSASAGGVLHGVRRTGSVLIGGLGGLVSRKGTHYETSDSEGGPGPSTLKNAPRNKPNVPLVIEPDLEEVDEQLDPRDLSPSPMSYDRNFGSLPTRASHLSAVSLASKAGSKRPSIITSLSGGSNLSLLIHHQAFSTDRQAQSAVDTRQHLDRSRPPQSAVESRQLQAQWEREGPHQMGLNFTRYSDVSAWASDSDQPGRKRSASDAADVSMGEKGYEWEIVDPQGTRRGWPGQRPVDPEIGDERRRRSYHGRTCHRGLIVVEPRHLNVDVELAYAVQQLRIRQQELAKKAAELGQLEHTILLATHTLQDHLSARRQALHDLKADSADLTGRLRRLPDEVDTDKTIRDLTNKIAYLTTGDIDGNVKIKLEDLMEDWKAARAGNEERRREAEVAEQQAQKGWWGWQQES